MDEHRRLLKLRHPTCLRLCWLAFQFSLRKPDTHPNFVPQLMRIVRYHNSPIETKCFSFILMAFAVTNSVAWYDVKTVIKWNKSFPVHKITNLQFCDVIERVVPWKKYDYFKIVRKLCNYLQFFSHKFCVYLSYIHSCLVYTFYYPRRSLGERYFNGLIKNRLSFLRSKKSWIRYLEKYNMEFIIIFCFF